MSPIIQTERLRLRGHTYSESHIERGRGQTLIFQFLGPMSRCVRCKLSHGPFSSPRVGSFLSWPNFSPLPPQPRVTFDKESPVPERSWRLRPYLGYDWIAGAACPMHTPHCAYAPARALTQCYCSFSDCLPLLGEHLLYPVFSQPLPW